MADWDEQGSFGELGFFCVFLCDLNGFWVSAFGFLVFGCWFSLELLSF